MFISYFQTLERISPSYGLKLAVKAEQLGFDGVTTADHFHPFYHSGAKCSFAWCWLSSVLAVTKRVICGTLVTAPILRYHPGIVAQAWATMAEMFPNRLFLGIGAGEAVNEMPLGFDWPSPVERVERLEEAIKIIKLLWEKNDFVSFNGKYFKLRRARLYIKPPSRPLLLVAAGGLKTAEIAGKYADGVVTVPQHFAIDIIRKFEASAKETNREPEKLTKHLDITFSYDEDYENALRSAAPKAGEILPAIFKYSIYDPVEIESYAKLISREAMKSTWIIFTDYDDAIKAIEKYYKLGFTHFHVESLSPDELKFLNIFGQKVLPYLKDTYKNKC
ncbi:MAG: TIGR03557 family F420-dependent LLM class oxidoreductase [Nitrososphaerota archaeon]